jgi:hypothetical protein
MSHANSNKGAFPGAAVLCASIASGPLVIICTGLASLYLQMPDPIEISPASVLAVLLLCVPAAIFGGFVAILPVLFWTFALHTIGEQIVSLRARIVWAAAGAGAGWIMARFAADDPAGTFGMIFTGILVALICRRGVGWD